MPATYFTSRQKVVINQKLDLIERTLPDLKLKIFFKSPAEFVNQSYFKAAFPKNLCSGIVYSFKYNSCNAVLPNPTMSGQPDI